MYTLLLIVHVIVSLFLIFIILIQSSKGDGVSDVFGGGSSQTTIFGTRASTFLTKATSTSAIIFMITCLSLGFISRKGGGSVMQRELFKQQVQQKVDDMMKGKPADGQAVPAPAVAGASTAPAAEASTPAAQPVPLTAATTQPAAQPVAATPTASPVTASSPEPTAASATVPAQPAATPAAK